MTDLSDEFWEGGYYGTTTLVEKKVDIQRVFRVHYKATRMQRDGLFVDVNVLAVDGMFFFFFSPFHASFSVLLFYFIRIYMPRKKRCRHGIYTEMTPTRQKMKINLQPSASATPISKASLRTHLVGPFNFA